MLTLAAFAATGPLVNLEPSATITAVPAAIAVVLIALFVMVTRRHAVSQAAGFLMLDNGIAATAFLLTAGVPLIVELGASLDVLFAVIVIGVLTGRLRAPSAAPTSTRCRSCTTDDRLTARRDPRAALAPRSPPWSAGGAGRPRP